MSERTKSIEDCAALLGREYLADCDEVEKVFWLPHAAEVQLVVVTAAVPRTSVVFPYRFKPEPPDVPWPYLVMMVHPADWLRRDGVAYPSALKLAEAKVVAERPAAMNRFTQGARGARFEIDGCYSGSVECPFVGGYDGEFCVHPALRPARSLEGEIGSRAAHPSWCPLVGCVVLVAGPVPKEKVHGTDTD